MKAPIYWLLGTRDYWLPYPGILIPQQLCSDVTEAQSEVQKADTLAGLYSATAWQSPGTNQSHSEDRPGSFNDLINLKGTVYGRNGHFSFHSYNHCLYFHSCGILFAC